MEKYKEKLRSDAQQLAEYADTSEYLTRAFFHIFGKNFWRKATWTAVISWALWEKAPIIPA